jgi:hypothetical protein
VGSAGACVCAGNAGCVERKLGVELGVTEGDTDGLMLTGGGELGMKACDGSAVALRLAGGTTAGADGEGVVVVLVPSV